MGPNDLSSVMGYPGQGSHPEVRKVIDNCLAEIKKAGKAAGTTAYDLDSLRKRKQEGFQYICYGMGPMLVKAGREYLQVARE